VASAAAFQAGGFSGVPAANGRGMQLRTAQRAVNAPRVAARKGVTAAKMGFDIEGLNSQMKDARLAHLEEQAMESLRASVWYLALLCKFQIINMCKELFTTTPRARVRCTLNEYVLFLTTLCISTG